MKIAVRDPASGIMQPRQIMEADSFLRELDRLKRETGSVPTNLSCYETEDCRNCTACMFCSGCIDSYRLTHCSGCAQCSNGAHCHDCTNCHDCAYCNFCSFCLSSSYLDHCSGCSGCTYCFGCVGLVKKEFYILNVRYPRKEYFEITSKLRSQLR